MSQNIRIKNGVSIITRVIFKKLVKPLQNALVIFLVFVSIAMPVAPAFAQTPATDATFATNTTNPATIDQQSFPRTSDSTNAAIFSAATEKNANQNGNVDSKATSAEGEAGTASVTSGLAISQNQYKLQSKVDSQSGAMIFNYPIEVPSGRNGLTPNLALSYNSQNTDEGSIFGYGWTLSGIPEISRVNKLGIDQLYSADTSQWALSSSLSGELVSAGTNVFKAKVNDGSFLTYNYNPSNQSFTVTDKNGTIYIFGGNSLSKQDNPNDSTQVYKWMITVITDSNGNTINFSYTKDSGQIYPSYVNYGPYQISFQIGGRSDSISNYKPGFYNTTNLVINDIRVSFNTTTAVKEFVLNYKTGDNGTRSLLNSVQVSAYDSVGSLITQPATTFNYTVSYAPNWVQSSSVTLPPNTSLTDGSSIATDFNGDGYTDILIAYQDFDGTVYKYAYLNKGDGTWALAPAYTPPDFFISKQTGLSYGWTAFDTNGDRLPDLVQSYKNNSDTPIKNTYLNTGSGWQKDTTLGYGLPVPLIWNNSNGVLPNVATVADLNGDGLMDISVYSGYSPYGLRTGTFLNNSGGTNGFRAALNPWSTSPNSADTKTNYTDINNDGVDDFMVDGICSSNNRTFIGNGVGVWNADIPSYNSTHSYCYPNNVTNINYWSDWGGRIFDINSDGLPDLVYSTTSSSGYVDHFTYLNTGSGWTANQSNFVLPSNINFSSSTGSTIGGFIDLNGDGISEIYSNGVVYVNQNAKYTDLLNSITYSTGAAVSATYKSSAQYKDASGNFLNPKLPILVQTVNTIITTEAVNNITNTDTYSYADGYFFYDQYHLRDKKFAGFGKVTKTDSTGNVLVSYFHTGAGTNAVNGAYADYFGAKAGKMYRQEIYGVDGKIYSLDIYKWDINYVTSSFVFLAQQTHQDYGQSTHKDTAISYTYNNANGNLLTQTNYGRVLGNNDGNFGDVGSDTFVTAYNYATGAGITGLPYQATVTDQSSNIIKQSKYYYDTLSLGNVSKGNLTKQEDLKSGSTFINNQKTYNSYGLVTSTTDANGNATNYNYDANFLYPTSITNAKNQTEQYVYNNAIGKVTQKTDANSRIFQYTYDGLGRLIQETEPDIASPSSQVNKTTYVYTDTPNAISIKKSSYLDASNTADSYTYFDGLGRKIQDKQEAENTNFSTKDYVYNSLGQLQKESLPYFSGNFNRTSATGDSTLYTNYVYDAISRVTSSTNSAGTTSNIYNDWKVTTTDANGKQKDYLKDAYGNLIEVDEHNAGQTYSTFYNYDYFGNLIKITDALGNVRNFAFNNLGQRTMAEDLHAPADATFGIYSYAYDAAGNLISKTDPKAQTVNYTYDQLNRLTSENYTGIAGVEVTYTYDQGIDGIGRLTAITKSGLSQANTYNALGLLKNESKVEDSKTFLTTYDYDRQGNQILVTNPDGSKIKNIYNSAGLLDQTQRKESTDANFVNVVTNFDYSPIFQITTQADANGTTTTNTYDAAKLYRLTNKVTTSPSAGQIQNLAYSYDNVGNITQLTDTSSTDSKKTVAYTYDDLYRLLSSTATNVATGQMAYIQTFTYDAIGNILTKAETTGTNPTKTTTYKYEGNIGTSFANPHAVTSTTTDANTSGTLAKFVNTLVSTPVTITNKNTNTSATSTKSVAMIVNPPAPVISTFVLTPSNITKGQTVTFNWALSGGAPTTLSINQNIGSVSGLTSRTITPTFTTPYTLPATVVYTLTATNAYGTSTKSVTLTANPPTAGISTLTASRSIITKGQTVTLYWTLAGAPATSASINGISVLGLTSKTFAPLTTTTYNLIVTNTSGSATKTITITVTPVAFNFINYAKQIVTKAFDFIIPTAYGISTCETLANKITAYMDSFDGQAVTYSSQYDFNIDGRLTPLDVLAAGITTDQSKCSCTPKATRSCASGTNAVFYFNSCGQKEFYADLTCAFNETCVVDHCQIQPPVINTFTATPTTITSGQSSTLSWTLSGGAPTTLSIDNSVGSVLGTNSKVVSPTVTTTYTLTATNVTGSVTSTATVTVNALPVAPIPTILPSDTSYSFQGDPLITITDSLTGANIYYTTDGTIPTTASTLYTGPFLTNGTTTILAIASKTGYSNSSVASKTYYVQVPTPTITPNYGSYTGSQTITLLDSLQGADIYYTLDGSAPTINGNTLVPSAIKYTVPFVLTSTTTVGIVAVKQGYSMSGYMLGDFHIAQLTAPVIDFLTISPTADFVSGQNATLNWSLSGGVPTSLSINQGVGSVLGTTSEVVSPTSTTATSITYTLTATNASGSISKSVSIYVFPAIVISAFTATPSTIISGQSATLSWTLSGEAYSTLSIDNGIGIVSWSGSRSVAPTTTTTYTFTATLFSFSTTKQVTVTVGSTAPVLTTIAIAPATANLTVAGTTQTLTATGKDQLGNSIATGVLTWTSDTPAVATVSPSGVVTPVSAGTANIIAKNSAGTITSNISVITVSSVITAPVISTFTADPITITAGQSTTLSWTLSGGAPTTLSIDNSVGSVLGTTSKVVSPTATTTYVLTATNSAGTVTASVTVTLNPPTPTAQTFTYDNNGNITSDGTFTYTFDYNNRLTSATNIATGAVTSYIYDASGQRIQITRGTQKIYYPTSLYNTTNDTIPVVTKHIFGGGQDLSTVQGTGASAKIYYNHSDSLASSSVMSDNTGAIAETMDYYAFGAIRLDTKPAGSTLAEQRKYIGQEFDQDTGLNYLNARYYNSAIGRFISEDPMFWDKQNLIDPQSMNSYSYANNNPIRYSDPSGQIVIVDDAVILTGLAVLGVYATTVIAYNAYQNSGSVMTYRNRSANKLEKQINAMKDQFDNPSENSGGSNNNGPGWKKWVTIGLTIGSSIVAEGVSQYKEIKDDWKKLIAGSNPINLGSSSNQNSSGSVINQGSPIYTNPGSPAPQPTMQSTQFTPQSLSSSNSAQIQNLQIQILILQIQVLQIQLNQLTNPVNKK